MSNRNLRAIISSWRLDCWEEEQCHTHQATAGEFSDILFGQRMVVIFIISSMKLIVTLIIQKKDFSVTSLVVYKFMYTARKIKSYEFSRTKITNTIFSHISACYKNRI